MFGCRGCTGRAVAPERHEAGVGCAPTPASIAPGRPVAARGQRENWYVIPSVSPRLPVHLLFDASAGRMDVLSSPTAK